MSLPALICIMLLPSAHPADFRQSLSANLRRESLLPNLQKESLPANLQRESLPANLRGGYCNWNRFAVCCAHNWRFYTYPEDFPEGARPAKCGRNGKFDYKQCNATHCFCTTAYGDPVGSKSVKIGEMLKCKRNRNRMKPKLQDIMISGVCRDKTLPCCKELWKQYERGPKREYRCDEETGNFKPRQCEEGGCFCVRNHEFKRIPNTFAAYPKRANCGAAAKETTTITETEEQDLQIGMGKAQANINIKEE